MLKIYSCKPIFRAFILLAFVFSGAEMIAQTQIHYWHFNALPSGNLGTVTPDVSLLPANAGISYDGTGAGYLDMVSPGTEINLQAGTAIGIGLRTRNPSATRSLIMALPTTGYTAVVVKFATARTSAGAAVQNYSYSLDGGTTYSTAGMTVTSYVPTVEPEYGLVTLDFSTISGASNNPNFRVRIDFGGTAASGSSGNNRFDNITVQGTPTAGGDTVPPVILSAALTAQQTIDVLVSEELTPAAVQAPANYSFTPSIAITGAVYNAAANKITLTVAGLTVGTAYQLQVQNQADLSGNLQSGVFVSGDLYYNPLATGLVISEIMYNPPSDNSNALEFLELYNTTDATIALGGIKVKDEGNFTYTFPEMTLASHATVLLAGDKPSADAFYGVSFIDLPQGISNALGNGGELLQVLNSQNQVVSSVMYDDAAPWPITPDGFGPSLELLNPNGDLNNGANWVAATNLVGISLGANVYASPGVYVPNVTPTIAFTTDYSYSNENAGNITIDVALSNASSQAVTATIAAMTTIGTAIGGTDYNFAPQTITFPPNSTASIPVTLNLIDNTVAGIDKFLVLELSNVTGANLGAISKKVLYVLDDDNTGPAASQALDVEFLTSYLVDASGSAEIVSYDEASQRLFVLNSTATTINILDFSNPAALSQIAAIDMTAFGAGATSVAVKNGIVAATVVGVDFADGKVVFMDTNGVITSAVTVGNLPDMVTFTHDGTKVLTANEGQPNADYSIDPEGSISVIDVSGGLGAINQSNVTTINFNAYDSQITALRAQGVRIFGPNATVSQDFEPEYITVAADNLTAWVTLQENNAIATIDLVSNQITQIIPLGTKDHSLARNTLDTSDQSAAIFMATWPIKGMYMPDGVANYTVGGTTYLVTANEGDAREYDTMEEETKVGAVDYVLDPTVFPDAAFLKNNKNLGRLAVTKASGDLDGDGDFDEIHVFGTRSFSIWNTTTGQIVYDSGDDFERITANDPVFGALFNASNDNTNFKNRSDNKGPEPEGITVAEINGRMYAFITLERIGGVMVYDITDPQEAVFVSYKNNRTVAGGDAGPEGIIYIKPNQNSLGNGLVVIANEVSATISVYKINNDTLGTEEYTAGASFKAYPNPIKDGVVFFSQPVDGVLYDLSGREVLRFKDASYTSVGFLSKGIYILKTKEGFTQKLIVE